MKLLTKPEQGTDPGLPVALPPLLKKQIIPYAQWQYNAYPFGHLLVQEHITQDYSIFSWQFFIDQPVTIFVACAEPTLALQYMLQGNINALLTGFGEIIIHEKEYSMFYVPPALHEARFTPGMYESFHIEFTAPYMESLSLEHEKIALLMNKLHQANTAGERLSFFKVNNRITQMIREIKNSKKSGGSLDLFINSCLYRLLSFYDEHTYTATHVRNKALTTLGEKLTDIEQYIVQHPELHEWDLETLARDYELTVKALKKHFRGRNNMSVKEYRDRACMQKAQKMLEAGQLTVKDISALLGYSDHSNFTHAFKKYFGYPPSSIRPIANNKEKKARNS